MRVWREERGLSQEELGKLVIASQSTISKLEAGKLQPYFDLALRIEKATGVLVTDWDSRLSSYLRRKAG